MTEDANVAKSGTNAETKQAKEEESIKIPVRLTMDKRIDLAIIGLFILLGVGLLIEASKIRFGIIPDPITSRGMPYLTGIMFIIGGIVLAVMRIVSWNVLPGNFVPGEGHEDEEGHPSSFVPVLTIAIIVWIAMLLLDVLGYLIVTPLYIIPAIWIMRSRTFGVLILFPVLYTVVSWYIFSQPLQFVLPLGFLAPLFRSWGLTP